MADRRPGIGIAWCHRHNMRLSECFDIHNPSAKGTKPEKVNYARTKEELLPERRKKRRAIYVTNKINGDERRLEISYKELVEMNSKDPWVTLPKLTLRSLGFDPDREIMTYDDHIRNVRVITQKVSSNGTDAAPEGRSRATRKWQNPLRRSG